MTKDQLLHLFEYNRDLGILIWKNVTSKYLPHLKGREAGKTRTDKNVSYREIVIEGKTFSVHRLVWFLENNEWVEIVDHIDGNGLNNKITNLRATNNRYNQHNTHLHRSGKLVGCYFEKCSGKWKAQIQLSGKVKNLGRFNSETEAHQRYLKALSDHNV